ncbi:MAG: GNAT family N-acetyltransferase [Acidobacteriota bacterium]
MQLIADLKEIKPQRASLSDHPQVARLTNGYEREVMNFLSARPLHTFGMMGFIRDHGLDSPLNRGSFYAHLAPDGRIEGVALIGHAVMFETLSERAVSCFARLALLHPQAFLVLGEQESIDIFCRYYSEPGRLPRLMCREILFQLRWPVAVRESVPALRQATTADLDLVVEAHNRLGIEDRGINCLEIDPEGFRQRCQWRVERGRTWVWIERGRLIFKADLICDTPGLAYLEGVWVDESERSKGYGVRCLSQLSRTLLMDSRSVCLISNEQRPDAQAFYRKVGFRPVACYQTLYL